jgi:hypothetical protein
LLAPLLCSSFALCFALRTSILQNFPAYDRCARASRPRSRLIMAVYRVVLRMDGRTTSHPEGFSWEPGTMQRPYVKVGCGCEELWGVRFPKSFRDWEISTSSAKDLQEISPARYLFFPKWVGFGDIQNLLRLNLFLTDTQVFVEMPFHPVDQVAHAMHSGPDRGYTYWPQSTGLSLLTLAALFPSNGVPHVSQPYMSRNRLCSQGDARKYWACCSATWLIGSSVVAPPCSSARWVGAAQENLGVACSRWWYFTVTSHICLWRSHTIDLTISCICCRLHPDLRNQQVPRDDQGTLRDKQSVGLAQAHRLGLRQQLVVEHCRTNCLEHTISLVLGSLLEPLNLTMSFPVVPAMLAHTLMILATSGPPTMVKDLYQYLKHC